MPQGNCKLFTAVLFSLGLLIYSGYNLYEGWKNHQLGEVGGDNKENSGSKAGEDLNYGFVAVSLLTLQACILYSFGQPLISKSGCIKLWEGSILSSENSQHITDWYTFTHILHGVIFYGILSVVLPGAPTESRYLLSLAVEIFWEILENSPIIIERYRASALAEGYYGDSILNSVCDALSMSFGFWLTFLLPVWVVVILAICEEIILANLIHDNLTLNLIQLIHPSEAISKWQGGFVSAKEGNPAAMEKSKSATD